MSSQSRPFLIAPKEGGWDMEQVAELSRELSRLMSESGSWNPNFRIVSVPIRKVEQRDGKWVLVPESEYLPERLRDLWDRAEFILL